jgi:hypothetical protein
MTMHRKRERSDLLPDEREVVGMPGDLVTETRVPARPRASSVMVTLRVDRPTFDELGHIAKERGDTFSNTVRDALRNFLRSQPRDRQYPNRDHSSAARRVSENIARRWSDDDLRAALVDYEVACRRNGMLEKAWRSYVDYARRFLAWRMGDYVPRGTMAPERPVPRSAATTSELRLQAGQYAYQVQAAGREQPTVDTYFRHAMFFIRWLEGDFDPGARLRGLG